MPFPQSYQFFPQGGNSAPLGPLGPQRDPRLQAPPQRPQVAQGPLPMPVPPGGAPPQDPRLTGLDRAREVANPQAAFLREGGQASEQARFNRPELAENQPGQRPAAGPQGFGRAFVPGSAEDNQARQQAAQFVSRLMQERPDMIAELIRRRIGQGGQGYGGDMVAQPMPGPGGGLPYGSDMVAKTVPPPLAPSLPYGNDAFGQVIPSPGTPYGPDMVAQPVPPQYDLSNLLSPLGLGGGFYRGQ